MTLTFAEECRRDSNKICEIDDYIDLWHDGDGDGKKLHEYLGMTWEEYGRWLRGARLEDIFNMEKS